MHKKKLPAGLKIVSILHYVIAVFTIISAVFMFVQLAQPVEFTGGEGSAPPVELLVFDAILLIGFAVLYFFVGRGLWKAQNWARYTAIILGFAVIIYSIREIIVMALSSMPVVAVYVLSVMLALIVNIFISVYLLSSQKAKAVFS